MVASAEPNGTAEWLEARYGLLQGTVTALGSALETTGGSALITSHTLVRGGPEASEPLPLAALRPGEHVASTTRFDGELRAKTARVVRIL